jgi:DNA helicase-2/ATP-dependent DNA helicase PcrA
LAALDSAIFDCATPSRFIEDVPGDVLEPVQLVEEDAADNAEENKASSLPQNGTPSSSPETTPDPPDGPPEDPSDADGLPF